ncbi:hypothetical protein AAJ76_16500071 [Vairimorpha ceranae]|uniref:Uncharacterized protein n=1 Tax=Vairimorpha ceranae TaxID=40302 RepID=A0A0F9WAJ0_9MICR|nr:hypothetical protein AAJ76_16500071 [Vairimorpha ceranae]KKO73945.1 hypothetical protein AAJ76_16500071 [Vairimorpha ceranae]
MVYVNEKGYVRFYEKGNWALLFNYTPEAFYPFCKQLISLIVNL